jgi:O-antigen/teichoic acid export membrane protein
MKIQQLYTQYKTPILYSGSSVIKAIVTILVSFVIAKYISPNDLGIWTTINLAVTYAIFLQAGLINGLNLELPLAYGKGDEGQAKIMAGTVQTFTIISSGVVLLLGLTYFLFIHQQNVKIRYGLLAITFVIMFSYYQNYLMSTFRSKNSFLKLSFIQIVDALIKIASVVIIAYYSYYGLIIRAVLVIFIFVILLHFTRPIKVRLIWNNASFLKLLKVGLPIFGLAYIQLIASTADRVLLLSYSGLTDVGLYSFGFNALNLFSLFSISIANYIYPRMTHSYGKNNNKHILWLYVKKITLLLFLIQMPLAIIGYYIIPLAITAFFPSYILSTVTMQILLFAGVFKGSVIGANALWSMKSWKYMIIYQIIFSILLVILPYLGIQLISNKLVGVSLGILVAYAINLISGISITYIATHKLKL